jgi:hypothetical protein
MFYTFPLFADDQNAGFAAGLFVVSDAIVPKALCLTPGIR